MPNCLQVAREDSGKIPGMLKVAEQQTMSMPFLRWIDKIIFCSRLMTIGIQG